MLTSTGAVTFPDANVDPATGDARPGAAGRLRRHLPADGAGDQPPFVRSAFPAERDPGLMLTAYRGDLGLDAGIPQSVYRLDQRQIDAGRLKPVGEGKLLRPGRDVDAADGSTVEFLGTRQ